ncbi:MAG: GmrSD restriction endonuclease domain-containing protein [Microbacterium gubbeenense]
MSRRALDSASPRTPLVPRWGWWIPIGIVFVIMIVADGFGGLLAAVAVVAFLGALFTLITNRPGALNLPSRRWATGALIASIVLTIPAGALLGSNAEDDAPVAAADPVVTETSSPAPTPTASEAPTATPTPTPSVTPTPTPTPTQVPPAEEITAESGTALALLATLPVKGSAPGTGYDRVGHFGESWIDVDGNGCDTRNDILQRDLTNLALDGSCTVLTGHFDDPYTGAQIDFQRGVNTSILVQIDHVVALNDAWRTGAQQLSQGQRIALANDPVNLRASDGSANGQKSDSNAASWLPSNKGFRCEYIARQVSTKAAYGLWVVPAERDVMQRVLETCPDQPAFASAGGGVPAPAEEVPQAPVPVEQPPAPQAPAPQPPAPQPPAEQPPAEEPAPVEHVSYENCAAVREAGAAPIRVGDPGYAKHLDRDGDGIGCE